LVVYSCMKIYISKLKENLTKKGGGFTFVNNLYKGLNGKVEFVDNWRDSDIVFIFGITTIDKSEIHEAVNSGKKLVLRVDNIPRKSRNKRQSPAERLKEFGNKADAVIYQSEWCKEYAGYFISNKNGYIINNGVDKKIFNNNGRNSDGETYLYINYNDNPNKRFDEALYLFDMYWRNNNKIHLVVAGNAPSIYINNPEYNWDLPTNGKVEYFGIMNTPEQVADVMKKSDYILCPYFAEAYSNVLIEAIACGLKPVGVNSVGGNSEIIKNWRNNNLIDTNEMCEKYLNIFNNLLKK